MSSSTFDQQKLYSHWSGCQIRLTSISFYYKTVLINAKTEIENEGKKTMS